MPRVLMSLLLHLLRADRRGRRLAARHRRHGVAGLRRFRRHVRDLHRIHRGSWNRQDHRRHRRNGAGPSNHLVQPRAPLQPVQPPAPLQVDENIDPALAAPPPPFWCSVHGWVVYPLHQYEYAVEAAPLQPPTPAVVEAESGAPLPRSPTVARVPDTPLVQVLDGDALAFVSAPTGASIFAFGSGAAGSSNHAVVDVDAAAPAVPNAGHSSAFASHGRSSSPQGSRRSAGKPAVKRARWHLEPGCARPRERRLQRRLPGDPAPWRILRRGRGRPEHPSPVITDAAGRPWPSALRLCQSREDGELGIE